MTTVRIDPTFESWREAARYLLKEQKTPNAVTWTLGQSLGLDLGMETDFDFSSKRSGKKPESAGTRELRVPAGFVKVAELAACFRDDARWALLYRLVWRLMHGEPHLLDITVDEDVIRVSGMAKAVSRDIHKMHAFVRFRRVADVGDRENYVAWHRPDHDIIRLATPFFVRRFATMDWSILTPQCSAFWDGQELEFGPGCKESPDVADDLEGLWLRYYASTFNPARIKIQAMKKEMPVRHWATLPETALIPELLANSQRRLETMLAAAPRSAEDFIPEGASWQELETAAKSCRACALCMDATQTVFGEGPVGSTIMLIGEQPGDQEDLTGRPFVGPAGQMLDQALHDAGIDRSAIYVTSAVKHFKFEKEGKVRIHKRANATEAAACKPWLMAEIHAIKPDVIVCLGVTAAQAILGRAARLKDERGKVFSSAFAQKTVVTTHPAAILRTSNEEDKAGAYAVFVKELRLAKDATLSISESASKDL